ncbi:MAG: T9SS type A sorting domain-containing protein [Flavobacteriales bacterium]|nr:T9SS type A sorting domain-containing protein [Flavobacteriales bacterium]MCB9193681.1 T9SS type A sorting domain-containing protein [Flavobacteriales bacterium]
MLRNLLIPIPGLLFAIPSLAQSDQCANAPLIGPGMYTADGPYTGGGATQPDATNADWYAYDPSQTGYITVHSCIDGQTDTRLNILSGSCSNLIFIAQDDDGCPSGYPPGNSLLANISVTPGITYYIEWDDRWTGQGFDWELLEHTCPAPVPPDMVATDSTITVEWPVLAPGATFFVELGPEGFTPGSGDLVTGTVGVDGPPVTFTGLTTGTHYDVYLHLDCGNGDLSPDIGPWPGTTTGNPYVPNEDCGGAIPIACGQSIDGSTDDAMIDNVADCGTSISAPGVWFTFEGFDGGATLSTCNAADFDTKINVYSGSCGALVCEGGNDDHAGCDLTSETTVVVHANTTYSVLVQGYNGHTGDFTLSLTCNNCIIPLDVQVTAADTFAYVYWNSANTASDYLVEYGPTGFTPGTGTTVTGTTGIDGPPAFLSGLDPGSDLDVYVTEDCGAGEVSPAVGPIGFTTSTDPVAVNATCIGALPIACGSQVIGDTQQGIVTPGPTCGAANITAPGLWYSFVGTGTDVTLSTCGQAAYDSKISVFTGGCGALVCAAGNDDGPGCAGNTSTVTFFAANGVDHLVLVHGYNANTGTFTLSMDCSAPCANIPANDDCTTAAMIMPQPIGACSPTAGTNVCAYGSAMPNPPCDPYANIVDVWYLFNTGPDPDHTITLESTGANGLDLAVYEACGTPTYLDCFTDVNTPIDLTGLNTFTDILLRVWNGGGADAGGFTICDQATLLTAVGAPTSKGNLRIWPVPAQEQLFIAGEDLHNGVAQIMDPLGRVVLSERLTIMNGTAVLDISGLLPGTYVLRLPDDRHGRFVVD